MVRQRRVEPAGLIKAVEIRYFRSFYQINFSPTRKMNVIFGENDTGKSNVMRALNLFFNGETSPSEEFDLNIDLSSRRRADIEGGSDVRTTVYVKVFFRTPKEHRTALGDEFYVKRTWSPSTGSVPRQECSTHIQNAGQKNSLTRFLNKTKFTYIPAVKDRNVYAKLLMEAYEAIASSKGFEAALQVFTEEIRNQTRALSERLDLSLGLRSALAPPTDLAELFSSLDFETLVGDGGSMSLLKQRGDGIQARHIPELISFIADRDEHAYHVWGIEEPENSLSMNSAVAAAKRLRGMVASEKKNFQLFITTHSPAFYALEGDDVAKFFLKKADSDVEVKDGTSRTTVELMEFMGDQFLLPAMSEALKAAERRNEELRAVCDALSEKIETNSRPLLFVEGPSDATVITALLRARRMDKRVEVVSLGGVNHAGRFSSMTPDLVAKLLAGRRGFVLLDSDRAGREALPKALSRDDVRRGWIASANGIYWRCLPPSPEAKAAFAAAGIKGEDASGVALEDCYPAAVKQAALDAGAFGLGPPRDAVRSGDLTRVGQALAHAEHRFYLHQPSEQCKTTFAEWLVNEKSAKCDILEQLMAELDLLLQS
ncbi:MAG: AAA family ATPase [Caulobacter sp.]|nr:AAA family ATPase [Caulobacter sp.]